MSSGRGHVDRVKQYAEELAVSVEHRWSQQEYNEDCFSEIAEVELRRFSIGGLSGADLLEWLVTARHLPFQSPIDEHFGKPHLTLWWSGRFQIDALFWDSATTDPHQHGFSGAFRVLAGSSLHSVFQFRETRRLNARLLLGEVSRATTELLTVGETRRIGRGKALIHSLFHLESPSVTLVVKTCGDPSGEPEYAYYSPSLALDVSMADTLNRKQLQAVDLLLESRGPLLEPLVSRLLSSCDGHTAASVLIRLCTAGVDPELFARLAHIARQNHREIAEAVLLGAQRHRMHWNLRQLRQVVRSPGHRFLLALAASEVSREEIDRILVKAYPTCEPSALITRWSNELEGAPAFKAMSGAIQQALHRLSREPVADRTAGRHGGT